MWLLEATHVDADIKSIWHELCDVGKVEEMGMERKLV